MPSIQVSEPSISKFVEHSTASKPGDEKFVYVLIGTPPPAEQTGVATLVEPTARPTYFDGKFLMARDLMREQASTSDTGFDSGINVLLGDGSVRDISPRDAALLAYDQGFLGGVTVAAGDSSDPLDAVIFAGDRYDPLQQQGIGGISVAVADIEGKGPHMLMTAGFMF